MSLRSLNRIITPVRQYGARSIWKTIEDRAWEASQKGDQRDGLRVITNELQDHPQSSPPSLYASKADYHVIVGDVVGVSHTADLLVQNLSQPLGRDDEKQPITPM